MEFYTLTVDGEEQEYRDIAQAVTCYQRAVSGGGASAVTLRGTRESLLGVERRTIASWINPHPVTPQRDVKCPACGLTPGWCSRHRGDATGQRIITDHLNHNHAQCHPASGCKIGDNT